MPITKKEYPSGLPMGSVRLLFCALLAALAVGSVWDLAISRALYNKSSAFGMFFACFAEYPMALGSALAGALLLGGHDRARRAAGAAQCAGGVLLLIFGVLVGVFLPARYGVLPMWAMILISVLACGLMAARGFVLARRIGAARARQAALAIFLFMLLEYLTVTVLKEFWSRPRFRLVAADGRAAFVPWWQPQSGYRGLLTPTGISSEEFRSFPSGHTSNAALLLGLALLPKIDARLAGRQRLLFWCGAAYAATVAVSRIIMGAHYLTDTVWGCTLTLAALCITGHLVYGRTEKTNAPPA